MGEGLESMGDWAKSYKRRMEDFVNKRDWCPKCGYLLMSKPCQTCLEIEAAEKQRREELYRYNVGRLGGLKAYEDYTEEKFDCRYYDAKRAIQVCSGFPNENLYVWGDRGVGKTHLGIILIRKHPQGRLFKPYEVLRQLRCLVLEADQERRAIAHFVNHPCLLLDDLGTEKLTEHALSLLYEIIDARDMGKKKGLLITSNYSLSQLADKMGDDRIPSRLSGMCRVIRLSGKDRRQEKNETTGKRDGSADIQNPT